MNSSPGVMSTVYVTDVIADGKQVVNGRNILLRLHKFTQIQFFQWKIDETVVLLPRCYPKSLQVNHQDLWHLPQVEFLIGCCGNEEKS